MYPDWLSGNILQNCSTKPQPMKRGRLWIHFMHITQTFPSVLEPAVGVKTLDIPITAGSLSLPVCHTPSAPLHPQPPQSLATTDFFFISRMSSLGNIIYYAVCHPLR